MHHAFPTRRSSDLHGKDGKPPYGYTLIDHAAKAVHKGGEVMPLAEFIALEVGTVGRQQPHSSQQEPHAWFQTKPTVDRSWETEPAVDATDPDMALPALDISISDDIDDEATLGRNRRRKTQARTNTTYPHLQPPIMIILIENQKNRTT